MPRLRRAHGLSDDDSFSVEDKAPGFMVTYGDMMTLILCFFVILFSISSINVKKFELAITSMKGALGLVDGGRTLQTEDLVDYSRRMVNEEIITEDLRQLQEIRVRVEEELKNAGLADAAVMEINERGLVVRLNEKILFDLGQATIKPEARVVLDHLGKVFASLPNHIRVEGHTDNLPINTYRYPSNWELSTGRATAVVRYFIEEGGLDPGRLSAAGFGEYRPLVPNTSEENRQLNRRVDILLMMLSQTYLEPQIREVMRSGGDG